MNATQPENTESKITITPIPEPVCGIVYNVTLTGSPWAGTYTLTTLEEVLRFVGGEIRETWAKQFECA